MLKKDFSIPANLEPINILVIGYADTKKEPALTADRHIKMRKPLSSTVSYVVDSAQANKQGYEQFDISMR